MRRTKIICTLGPATESKEIICRMIEAGANIFRLNMSHAKHDWVRGAVMRIREAGEELGAHVGILLDTQGPAIRTGDVPATLQLKPGDFFEFRVRGAQAGERYSVDVNYSGLVDDISVGDTVVVDNGVIHLLVLSKTRDRIRCKVLTEGSLGSRRHINLPGVEVNLPSLTEKDLADVALGAALGVDFVALSFAREKADIEALRRVLDGHGSDARIIAKIEDRMAVRNLNDMIVTADAIMVARGDLGIECPMEELPIIQRRIIKRCLQLGRPVIVATHMLESMIEKPLPTRAEITDVANAVFEEADAIMLSGETAVGRYPVECVKVLDRVARRIERSGGAGYAAGAQLLNLRQKTAHAAVVLANQFEAARVIVFTRRGVMASYAAALRPRRAPIIAFAPNAAIARKVALARGTEALVLDFQSDPQHTISAAEELLRTRGLVAPGDQLVILSDVLAGDTTFDSIQLRTVAG